MRRPPHRPDAVTHLGTPPLEAPPAELLRLPGEQSVTRLDNGLTVSVLRNPQAPIVSTAVWYRAGTRDEPDGHGGTAHFLEHMMFKGSRLYGPGEIDRRTQVLGGSNNAFTSHDSTAYYFDFARDRWQEALAIEADRMAALTLDPAEIASERQVILEEIAMYEGEPWDALEMRVLERLFGAHPYGHPVLGTREDLLATGEEDLRRFHRRFYRPDNAVLVVAGDVGEDTVDVVAGAFTGVAGGADERPPAPPLELPSSLLRLERRKGELARLLLALPGPAGGHPDHAALRLLATLLAGGRASRLQRLLVDERQLCSWVSADLGELQQPGFLTVAAELVPGAAPTAVEEELLAVLAALTEEVAGEAELARARQIVLADWVFAHERVHQQGLAAGFALALFDRDHPERQLRRLLTLESEELREVARRYLRPETGGVLGWSLPREER